MQTRNQYGINEGQRQGWKLARERLLRLLDRIRLSTFLGRNHLSDSELERLNKLNGQVISAIARIEQRIKQSQVSVRTVSNLKCPRCKEHSITLRLVRGVVNGASATCHFCGWSLRVARLKDAPIAQCPKCRSVATIAQGRREDGRVFFAFHCDRCDWISDDAWISASFALLPH